MRILAFIQGLFVILAILVFSGLNITWVFAGAALLLFAVDCVSFYGIIFGKTTFVERLIKWLSDNNKD